MLAGWTLASLLTNPDGLEGAQLREIVVVKWTTKAQLVLSFVGLALAGTTAFRFGLLKKHLLLGWQEFRNPKTWNGIFFALTAVVFFCHNSILLWRADLGGSIFLSSLVGRVATHLAILSGAFFLLRLLKLTGPYFLSWGRWLIAGALPFLILADLFILIYWNKSLLSFINNWTDNGRLDIRTELAGAGLEMHPQTAILIVAGGYLFAGAFALWLDRWSKKRGMEITGLRVLAIALGVFLVATGEQKIGAFWKPMGLWQKENQLFNLHLSTVQPPLGLAEYQVRFRQRSPDPSLPKPTPASLPDIHFLMVESLRSDFLLPEFTPNLIKLRDEDAQPIARTYAASNGTHISWFSVFHSRPPVFWREAMTAQEEGMENGAYPLKILKDLGYRLEVRAGCPLNYKSMGPLNFGKNYALADSLRHRDDDEPFTKLSLPTADLRNVEAVMAALSQSGPVFYFTSLESTHYHYFWHRDFDPPIMEYDKNVFMPATPTREEIQRIKNRYHNSTAWADHLVGQYLEALKKAGKYDRSILVITSDHGEEFQERGGWFHTSSLEAEQTEVPILIKWPKKMAPGPAHETASHIDIFPSLLDALGQPLGEQFSGRSLLQPSDEHTVLRATPYPGQSRECMRLSRKGYEASFYWRNYWNCAHPEEITLLRFTGPDGDVICNSPADYQKKIAEVFPDYRRFFDFE
jgi:hypothetical protein